MTATGSRPLDEIATRVSAPIEITGAIQPFGVLLAIEPDGERIIHASANAQAELGRAARDLIGAALGDLLALESLGDLRELIQAERHAPTRFSSVVLPSGRMADASVHRSRGLVLAELIPKPACDANREATLAADAILRAQRLVDEMRRAPDLSELLSVAVAELRALTGFDQVIAYRLDDDHHGKVAARSVACGSQRPLGPYEPVIESFAHARRISLRARAAHPRRSGDARRRLRRCGGERLVARVQRRLGATLAGRLTSRRTGRVAEGLAGRFVR